MPHGDSNEVRLLNAAEVKKSHPVREAACDPVGKFDGERCLADAARSAKRDEATADEMIGYRQEISFPPDDPCGSRGKIGMGCFIDRVGAL